MGRGKSGAIRLPGYGLSQICPYIPGEDPRSRHDRRYRAAAENREMVREWCRAHGVKFNCNQLSGGQYERWEFRSFEKFAAWVPHLGKMLAVPQFGRGARVYQQKVYDWEQLLNALGQWLAGAMS